MKNIIKAFAQNRVFANLLMVTVLMAGILSSTLMIREDMPEMDLDFITISVAYPGADPEEIEEGISRKIEEAIDGLEGIDEYTSTSSEGISNTTVMVIDGYDADVLLDRIRNEVDGITTFPDDAEEPSVVRPQIQKAVISLGLVSQMPEARLKEWADDMDKKIGRLAGVSQVEISGTRAYEIAVELDLATLMKYDLTINEVAGIIANGSLNLSGGTVKTSAEEIRLRTMGRKYTGKELADIKIISGEKGDTLYLGDIATIKDGFTENNLSIQANGTPAVIINVLAGDEDTIDIADQVRAFVKKENTGIPEGSRIIILSDNTEKTRANLEILFSNAVMGLILVFILLWLFMDTKVSFWAGMGIPISLLGGLAIVHFSGITLNKITLFGLIMVLGIVADDAIVVGESIFHHREKGAGPLEAVVKGVSEVGMPVLAAVLTTIVAFLPLYHINGIMGKFILALPSAVIACLVISLLECMVMLPAHLSNIQTKTHGSTHGAGEIIDKFHAFTVGSMDWAARQVYLPILKTAVRFRYLFLSLCISGMLLCTGLVTGGMIKFNVFPKQASNIVVASVEFPDGTPFEKTQQAVNQMEKAVYRAAMAMNYHGTTPLVVNTLATIGQAAGEKETSSDTASPNIGGVRITLLDPGESGIHSDDFMQAWEHETGNISGVQTLDFSASNSGPPGAPVQIGIQGDNLDNLSKAAEKVMATLRSIDGVSQVFSDNSPGKNEFKFYLKPEAEYLGVNLSDVASQIYGNYYGIEAVKIQRDNDEVEVNVRLTQKERHTRTSLETMKIKTADNTWVPLSALVDITYSRGFSTITRKNGMRQIKVSAKVDTNKVVSTEVIHTLDKGLLKELSNRYPGIVVSLDGDAKRSAESFGSLHVWVPIAVMGMFVIIATMFRSYVQPALVLLTIPFGLMGAVLGHFVMGHMLSLLSVFGMVALAGVVVNDAIVLIERVNMNLEQGMKFFNALFKGGTRRFRAVMLTSLSTVGGLAPLILETSQHAQQLVPMGISLAFGVAFATVLTLILLPCMLCIVNDIRQILAKLKGKQDLERHELEPAFQRRTDELDQDLSRSFS
ncbi:Multidrug efflux pump subunit AcrB [Desulfocicer vacuolatum DSM 3385]|uniref:Multidrug efflux pump subunit AcrB n=1 Tax=Desulfocicer vacuolatum DSM 3385 TaxID=1121400 RepID=A0A1W2ELM0_9BACT|nr:efflux RND transporter permease subunit [Desulfocicer vacuolatum]SMD10619.1 Multidrug efflux pump subunit AcrB [Desulfocicer vacuolatum DSM 3385]